MLLALSSSDARLKPNSTWRVFTTVVVRCVDDSRVSRARTLRLRAGAVGARPGALRTRFQVRRARFQVGSCAPPGSLMRCAGGLEALLARRSASRWAGSSILRAGKGPVEARVPSVQFPLDPGLRRTPGGDDEHDR